MQNEAHAFCVWLVHKYRTQTNDNREEGARRRRRRWIEKEGR